MNGARDELNKKIRANGGVGLKVKRTVNKGMKKANIKKTVGMGKGIGGRKVQKRFSVARLVFMAFFPDVMARPVSNTRNLPLIYGTILTQCLYIRLWTTFSNTSIGCAVSYKLCIRCLCP